MPSNLATTAKLAVLLVLLSVYTGLAQAQAPAPTIITFPMVGLGHEQTLRVNLLPTVVPCDGQVLVTDVNGTTKEFLNFDFQNLSVISMQWTGNGIAPKEFPNRAELYTVVTLTPPAGSVTPCSARASLELYDNLAEFTSLVVSPPPQTLPVPPTFPPAGLGYLQTARLNVVAHPPQGCYGTLSYT